MEYVLNEDFMPEKYFEDISRIPRGSYNEKAASDYVLQFAKDLGLECSQDDMYNVFVKKPASPGYEDHEPVMLQAHLDMVCEKTPGSDHDFETDPVELVVDDGWVHAKDTTLGADDGYGVAYIMAVLADDTLEHPPLECLFTVQEEVGLCGAAHVDGSMISARRLIGLDGGKKGATDICSAGIGIYVIDKEISYGPNDLPAYRIGVSGLKGGHSGGKIHLELANAIKLAARALYLLTKSIDLKLVSIDCHGKMNSIARNCEAVFVSDADPELIKEKVSDIEAIYKAEYADSDPGVSVSVAGTVSDKAMSAEDTKDIIGYLNLYPDGMRHRSLTIDDLAMCSDNIGIIWTYDDRIEITSGARGGLDSFTTLITDEIAILSDKYGWTIKSFDFAPSWPEKKDSKLREMYKELYESETGEELKYETTHGGLELSYLCTACPGIDIITLGPEAEGAHTTEERLNLASFKDSYERLTWLLAEL